jgi:hypothetical protein
MKISEALVKLQEILDKNGDLEVIAMTDADGVFIADFDLVFDVIELPSEDETSFETVCALLEDLGSDGPTTTQLKIVRD